MNRYDKIQSTVREIADRVCDNPDDRDQLSADLISLVAQMIDAVGKSVAVDGESAMNGADGEADAGGARFLVCEDIQRGVREVLEEVTVSDLGRYEAKRPPELPPVPDPFTGPAPFTAGPFTPGELTAKAHQATDDMREQHKTPVPDERPLFAPGAEQYYRDALGLGPKPCDAQDCPAHGDRGRIGPCVKDTTVPVVLHTWVTATDGDTGESLGYAFCGACGVWKCTGDCGDPDVGATPDIDCPVHGNDVARRCVERCVGCGDPVDNGRAHGPSQGFGGCC